MISKWIISMLLMLLATGCTKQKKQKKPKQHVTVQQSNAINIQEFLALHSEIPDTLLGFDVESVQIDPTSKHGFEVVYKPKKQKNSMTQQDIKNSYLADMELLGWKLSGQFIADDMQLLFQRPSNLLFCLVIIHKNNKVSVTILQK